MTRTKYWLNRKRIVQRVRSAFGCSLRSRVRKRRSYCFRPIPRPGRSKSPSAPMCKPRALLLLINRLVLMPRAVEGAEGDSYCNRRIASSIRPSQSYLFWPSLFSPADLSCVNTRGSMMSNTSLSYRSGRLHQAVFAADEYS